MKPTSPTSPTSPTPRKQGSFWLSLGQDGSAEMQNQAEIKSAQVLVSMILASILVQIIVSQFYSPLIVLGSGIISMLLLSLTARDSKEIVINDETHTTKTSSDLQSNIKESNIKLDVFEGKNRRIKTDRRMPWSPLRQEGRRISDGAEDQINDDSELHG